MLWLIGRWVWFYIMRMKWDLLGVVLEEEEGGGGGGGNMKRIRVQREQ